MTPNLTSRLPNVGTTIFSVMSALAVQHKAVNLGQGFPDFACDPALVNYVSEAMQAGHNQYPPMPGVPHFRDAIALKIEALHARPYRAADEITITAGATQAIITTILAIATRAANRSISSPDTSATRALRRPPARINASPPAAIPRPALAPRFVTCQAAPYPKRERQHDDR